MDTQNQNDLKVVEFYNSTSFDFTPELGCMYDGRPLFVRAGEKKQFPYHVGILLAQNLAKAVLIKGAPTTPPKDADGNPMIKPIWSDVELERIKNSFLTDLYSEEKPVAKSETDILMARVAELEKRFKDNEAPKEASVEPTSAPKAYQDKAEVIAELEKRGIAHDKRKKKEELENLLA